LMVFVLSSVAQSVANARKNKLSIAVLMFMSC